MLKVPGVAKKKLLRKKLKKHLQSTPKKINLMKATPAKSAQRTAIINNGNFWAEIWGTEIFTVAFMFLESIWYLLK